MTVNLCKQITKRQIEKKHAHTIIKIVFVMYFIDTKVKMLT